MVVQLTIPDNTTEILVWCKYRIKPWKFEVRLFTPIIKIIKDSKETVNLDETT